MARSRGFPRGRLQGANRRLTSWEEGPGGTAVTTITTSSSTFLGAAVTPTQDGLTQVRLRGELLYMLTAASAGLDGFVGAFGIGLATAAAVTAGAASVPTPITEQAWDGWIYWQPIFVTAVGAIDGSVAGDKDFPTVISGGARKEIDTKAMRKLKLEDSIYAIVELTEVGTAATLALQFDCRILLKLP